MRLAKLTDLEKIQFLWLTLERIAKKYQKPNQLKRGCERDSFGLGYEETIETAYENIQQEAANAIKRIRYPKLSDTKKSRKQQHK